ncbi:ShlB/FhaC/HecB family hemolysin secretion/activation protein [Allosphingosinicella sp.]|uniref:ShlB/FhaC/HecB family hemolysin secretion/activation protein n=1 Tax=Allosphingosinicella sp. TaxID=2823234 RepID=UPI003783995E
MGERSPTGSGRRAAIRAFRTGLAAGAVFCAVPAFAQPPAQPAPPTRQEIDRPPPPSVEQPRARLTVEGGIERAPCALDRPEYQNIRFTLSDVAFDDLHGMAADQLRSAWARYQGQEVNVAVICEIRDRAATMLREAGYIAAVEVPEQRIADGRVHFTVLMAKLVGIRVRGDAGRSERLIAGYLNKLTEQEVFNRFDAERYLLLAGDLPGYEVRLALRSANAGRGEVIGEVSVVHTPVMVDLNVQNLGSRELGRWGALLRAQIYGLTGLGDRTTLAVYSTADTHEQQTVQVGHDFRVGGEGLTLGGQLTYSWANPDLNLPNVDLKSRTLFATVEANYPFIRRQSRTLRGSVGVDIIDQDIDFNGLPLNRDRLRVAYARLVFDALGLVPGNPEYTPAEPRWRLGLNAEARQGLSILGASAGCGPGLINCLAPGVVPPTRLEGDPTATVFRGGVSAEYRPIPRLTFAFSLNGQYSAHPLLSFEEFSAGNYTAGRGYDPGALLGDSGVGLQAELRYGRKFPRRPDEFVAEPYLFFDHAWVWNQDVLFALGRQELSSIGGGVRAAWGDRFRLDVFLATPLDRLPFQTSRGDTRLLVSLTTRLWPWRSR